MIQMTRWGGVPTWHEGSHGSSCSQTSASKIVRGGEELLSLDVVKVPGWDLGVAGWEQLPIPWVGGGIGRKPALAGTLWHSAQHNPELGAGKGASLFESVSCLHSRLRTGDRGGGQKGGSGLKGQTLGLSILRFLSRPQIL